MRCGGSAGGLLWSFFALLSTVETRVREIPVSLYPHATTTPTACPDPASRRTRAAELGGPPRFYTTRDRAYIGYVTMVPHMG